MNILVTGADGFVGRRLVARLLATGHAVTGAVRPGGTAPDATRIVPLELGDAASVAAAVQGPFDVVVHLAAIASGGDARRDPGTAWEVNAAGTARLAETLGPKGTRLLLVSTAEVYGAGRGPRREVDAPAPLSPYAASKLGGEVAALEVSRRTGMPLVIARPFPHIGPGQDERFVVPAFARRIRDAGAAGRPGVRVGNLDPVRDFLHVDDVVTAYLALLDVPSDGSVYNIASGHGVTIEHVFRRLAELAGVTVEPEVDPALVRPADIPELVGDASRLRNATGWRPQRGLDETLREVIGAQAD